MDLEEHDLTNFDVGVMELFDICRKIMKSHEKRILQLSNRGNPIANQMEKYARIYSKSYPKDHVGYFENIFTKHKGHILIGPQRDSWIGDENSPVRVTFGEGTGVNANINWFLTSIYATSVKMAQEMEEETKGLPLKTPEEIKFPQKFLLAMYKTFLGLPVASFPQNYSPKLKEHIATLERQTGTKRSGDDGGLGGILDMVSPLMESFTGQKLDKNNLPQAGQLQDLLSNFAENPQTKNMIGNLAQNLKGANNIQELAGKFLGVLGGMAGNAAAENATKAEPLALAAPSSGGSAPSVNDEFEDY